jgi:radical SAM protein with 4Fe4S-binding SPASM domain
VLWQYKAWQDHIINLDLSRSYFMLPNEAVVEEINDLGLLRADGQEITVDTSILPLVRKLSEWTSLEDLQAGELDLEDAAAVLRRLAFKGILRFRNMKSQGIPAGLSWPLPPRHLNLQWHITAACDQRCRHCYMYDSPGYKSELASQLTFNECLAIINDYESTLARWHIRGEITLSGGDPLLHPRFFDLLAAITLADRDGRIDVDILGNPYHVDPKTAARMKEHGVAFYQLSLDGLRQTHDALRRPGSFDETLRALRALAGAGIETGVMFTLGRHNAGELVEVMRLAGELGVGGFAFDQLVPAGKGIEMQAQMLTPPELRQSIDEAHHYITKSKQNGTCQTDYTIKPHLYTLYLAEEGLLEPPALDKKSNFGGCGIGRGGFALLADGTVYPCRRLGLELGHMPRQTFTEIFIESCVLNDLRRVDRFKICSGCELWQLCRGCPAQSYALSGDCFGKPAGCWKC